MATLVHAFGALLVLVLDQGVRGGVAAELLLQPAAIILAGLDFLFEFIAPELVADVVELANSDGLRCEVSRYWIRFLDAVWIETFEYAYT